MLKLKSIEAAGNYDKERIVMQVETRTEDTDELDLGHYAIFGCRFSTDAEPAPLAGVFDLGYWFNKKKLEPGDYVVLYSKRGKRAEKSLPNGSTSHFFYWGSEITIWDGNVRPVLVQTGRWNHLEEQEFSIEPPSKVAKDDEIPF